MDFKIVKPLLRKNLLWMGSVIFSVIVIGLIIVLTIPLSKNNKIVYASQITLNFLLIYFVTCILNMSKTMVSLFTDIHKETDLETKEVFLSVKSSRYQHIFIVILVVAVFFIQIASSVTILKLSFESVFRKTWWVYLIIALINLVYLYLFFGINVYLLDNSSEFKNAYLDSLAEYKMQKEIFEKTKASESKKVELPSEE